MKGRLLIVAIAAFRVVEALDVAALVSNMTLAEKESLLSGIGWGPDDYDPEAGWYVGNTPSIPRLNIPPILMQDAGQGFFFFQTSLCCLLSSKFKQVGKLPALVKHTHDTHTKRSTSFAFGLRRSLRTPRVPLHLEFRYNPFRA